MPVVNVDVLDLDLTPAAKISDFDPSDEPTLELTHI